jgi:hypothetical protein
MGKRRRSARQDVKLLTELGDIVGLEFETEPGYIVSSDTVEAWHQDYNQQTKDEKRGRVFQVISERSKNPLKIFQERKPVKGQTTEVIASQTQDSELAFMNSKREKNKMLIWVGIIAALLAVVISIVVLVKLKSSGNHTVTPVVTALAIGLIGNKKKSKTKIKDVIEEADDILAYNNKETENIQCMVVVEKTGLLTYPRISNTLIPEDSIERNYKGHPCHLLGLNLKGELWAIEPENEIKINENPKDLFIALQYEKEVDAVYSLSESVVEKIKIGLFFLLCVVELIILFLIITTVTGGAAA